jgi:hypothetical protein
LTRWVISQTMYPKNVGLIEVAKPLIDNLEYARRYIMVPTVYRFRVASNLSTSPAELTYAYCTGDVEAALVARRYLLVEALEESLLWNQSMPSPSLTKGP